METAFIIIGVFGSIFVWLTLIRPFAVKHGQGYTTGANLYVAVSAPHTVKQLQAGKNASGPLHQIA